MATGCLYFEAKRQTSFWNVYIYQENLKKGKKYFYIDI